MDEHAAQGLAEHHLAAALPRRWQHVQGVAAEAGRLCDELQIPRRVAVPAAWLHDIGYAPAVAYTGFHPLDGARYLRAHSWHDEICRLVAHHSDAAAQADEDLANQLRTEFHEVDGMVRDVLWTADATTGPSGERLTLDDRIAETADRYGADHPVAVHMRASRAALEAAIGRTAAALSTGSD